MRMKWMLTALIAMGLAVPMSAAAQRQFDIGASVNQSMTAASSGNGTLDTPTNGLGGLLEIRYIQKPLLGLEFVYGMNEMDTTFSPKTGACGYVCSQPITKLSVKANNVAFDYVPSRSFGKLRVFALAGVGFNITSATATTYGVREVIRGAYNFGGGVDYTLTTHIGVRAQFRDFLFKAPNNSSLYPATGIMTYSAQPMGGIYYKF